MSVNCHRTISHLQLQLHSECAPQGVEACGHPAARRTHGPLPERWFPGYIVLVTERARAQSPCILLVEFTCRLALSFLATELKRTLVRNHPIEKICVVEPMCVLVHLNEWICCHFPWWRRWVVTSILLFPNYNLPTHTHTWENFKNIDSTQE